MRWSGEWLLVVVHGLRRQGVVGTKCSKWRLGRTIPPGCPHWTRRRHRNRDRTLVFAFREKVGPVARSGGPAPKIKIISPNSISPQEPCGATAVAVACPFVDREENPLKNCWSC